MNLNPPKSAVTPEHVRMVSPALAQYTQEAIDNDLWKRPALSPRDRCIVTAAALIARMQTIGMLHYFNLALDHGVTPRELSEVITVSGVLLRLVERLLGGRDREGHLCPAWHRRGSGFRSFTEPPSYQSRGRSATRHNSGAEFRCCRSRFRSVHDRLAIPQSLPSSGTGAAGSKSCHGERAHRFGPSRADSLPSQPSHGQRLDPRAGL